MKIEISIQTHRESIFVQVAEVGKPIGGSERRLRELMLNGIAEAQKEFADEIKRSLATLSP